MEGNMLQIMGKIWPSDNFICGMMIEMMEVDYSEESRITA
jgi:hypothetical protein